MRALARRRESAGPLAAEVALLRKTNAHLTRRLARADAIISVQKKLADLLGIQLAPVAPETELDNAF